MSENFIQNVSLVGQVVEDVTYEPLRQGRFTAELLDMRQSPQYKPDGFFVFADLPSGAYVLRISGQQWHTLEYPVTAPLPDVVLALPGENELFVVAKTITDTDNGGKRITFDPLILRREIRAGASVFASGFAATLAAPLELGKVIEARVENMTGELTVGSILRIIRDHSIRLPFSPYASLPFAHTRLVGTVMRQDAPEIFLPGAHVRLTAVNHANVVLHDVAGANIATVELHGTQIVLGTEKDMTTLTNQQGDYNLYFIEKDFLETVTLEVTCAGYQPATQTEPVRLGQRNKIDVLLISI